MNKHPSLEIFFIKLLTIICIVKRFIYNLVYIAIRNIKKLFGMKFRFKHNRKYLDTHKNIKF